MKRRGELLIAIGGHEIPVVVSSEGVFWAEWEGDSVRSETFKGLRAKLGLKPDPNRDEPLADDEDLT